MNKNQILQEVLGSGKGSTPEAEVQAFGDAIIADRVRAMQERKAEGDAMLERDEIAIPDPEIDEPAPLTLETSDVATDEPEIIVQPSVHESSAMGGRSLRQMRQDAAMKSLPVAPKLELLKDDQQPSEELQDVLPVEQSKDAPVDIETIRSEASNGTEKALSPIVKGLEPLEEIVAFDGNGESIPGQDKPVQAQDFKEGGVVVADPVANTEIIADALKSNNELSTKESIPAETNDLRAARLLGKAPVVPEKPIADIAPEIPRDNIDSSFLPESVHQEKASVGTGDSNIIFDSNEPKPVGVIADKALEHGTSDSPVLDRMAPVLQGGLATRREPVMPEDVANLEPKKVAENADKLVSEAGGLAEAAPTEVAVDNSEAKITEPHPFVPAGAPVQEQIIPLATGEKTDEQKLVDMIANGESLDGTVPVAETPVKAKATPEIAVATPEVVPAQAEPKLELLKGKDQPSEAVPPVVQPEAPVVVNADPSGIWQPKAKKSIFSKIFGDRHPAKDLSYHPNPNITADQVLATKADGESEEPKIADAA